jgi:hypothetical protein
MPLILLYSIIALAFLIAMLAIYQTRKRRTELDWQQSPKLPALKLFLVAWIVQTLVWLSENMVGLVKGVRYPWISHPEGYFLLGFIAALIGIVVSLYLTPKLKLSHDPYQWFLRAVAWLAIFIILLSFGGVKMALYPAIALLLLSLAMIVRQPWLKFVLWILSPHFMFHLAFSEGFTLFGRMLALDTFISIRISVVLHLLYIVVFALYSFPFLLGFAAVYFDSEIDLLWLKRWRSRKGLITTVSAFIVCVVMLIFIPSYSDSWRQTISVEEVLDANNGIGTVRLKSNEYMRNTRVHVANKDTVISNWDREVLLKNFCVAQPSWLQTTHTTTVTQHDSSTTFDVLLHVSSKYRPHTLNISFSAGAHLVEDVSTPYTATITGHSVSIRWETFPDTSLLVPIHFTVVRGDSVKETIEANYIEMIEPITVVKQWTNVVSRTTIKKSENLSAKNNE